MSKTGDAARRAIELDPQNGEAYSALGLAQAVLAWNWAEAEQNLKRGIALSPNSSEAELFYAIYLDGVNRPEEAVAHMRRALELDPESFLVNRHLGSTLYFARSYGEALVHLMQAAEMAPDRIGFVAVWASRIYEIRGMRDKAVDFDITWIRTALPQVKVTDLLSVYRRDGWNAYWTARMKIFSLRPNDPCTAYDIGLNEIRLGKADRAFPFFIKAIKRKCWESAWMMVDPMVDPIRSDRRFPDLLARMNLPR